MMICPLDCSLPSLLVSVSFLHHYLRAITLNATHHFLLLLLLLLYVCNVISVLLDAYVCNDYDDDDWKVKG